MNGFHTTLFGSLILLTTTAQASLPQDINNYFRKIHTKPNQVSIEIKTPIERWPSCEKPQILPPVGNRNMGNVSLPVQCGKKKQFIQLTVNVTGQYYVATRNICLLYTSPSPRDRQKSRMPSSA